MSLSLPSHTLEHEGNPGAKHCTIRESIVPVNTRGAAHQPTRTRSTLLFLRSRAQVENQDEAALITYRDPAGPLLKIRIAIRGHAPDHGR